MKACRQLFRTCPKTLFIPLHWMHSALEKQQRLQQQQEEEDAKKSKAAKSKKQPAAKQGRKRKQKDEDVEEEKGKEERKEEKKEEKPVEQEEAKTEEKEEKKNGSKGSKPARATKRQKRGKKDEEEVGNVCPLSWRRCLPLPPLLPLRLPHSHALSSPTLNLHRDRPCNPRPLTRLLLLIDTLVHLWLCANVHNDYRVGGKR